MNTDAETEWWERYAAATVEDQRRALYGRCCHDLTLFLKEHAGDCDDVYALRDLADQQFRTLLEAAIGLVLNISPALRKECGFED